MEDRFRTVPGCPGPGSDPLNELFLDVREVLPPERLPDLPLVLEPGFLPLYIPFKARWIGHANLPGNEIDHSGWNIQGIFQESTQMTNRRKLESEPEPHMLASTPSYQRQIRVVEEEHPIQVRLRHRRRVPTIGLSLSITQKLHRHEARVSHDPVNNPEKPTNKLAREGVSMTGADLAKFEPNRCCAVLCAMALEGMATVTEEVIELHDQVLGRIPLALDVPFCRVAGRSVFGGRALGTGPGSVTFPAAVRSPFERR